MACQPDHGLSVAPFQLYDRGLNDTKCFQGRGACALSSHIQLIIIIFSDRTRRPLEKGADARRAILQSRFNFLCKCERCVSETAAATTSRSSLPHVPERISPLTALQEAQAVLHFHLQPCAARLEVEGSAPCLALLETVKYCADAMRATENARRIFAPLSPGPSWSLSFPRISVSGNTVFLERLSSATKAFFLEISTPKAFWHTHHTPFAAVCPAVRLWLTRALAEELRSGKDGPAPTHGDGKPVLVVRNLPERKSICAQLAPAFDYHYM